jgi:hypothetical protein
MGQVDIGRPHMTAHTGRSNWSLACGGITAFEWKEHDPHGKRLKTFRFFTWWESWTTNSIKTDRFDLKIFKTKIGKIDKIEWFTVFIQTLIFNKKIGQKTDL